MRFACTFLAGLLLGTTLPTESATFKPTNLYLLEAAESFPSNLSTLVSRSGGSLLSVYPEVGLAVARSDSTSFARKMARQSGIARITRDLETQWTPPVDGLADRSFLGVAAAETPPSNDPVSAYFYACQWSLRQIDAPGAWTQGAFGTGVKVAVLDTGVDPFHVDLAGRIDVASSTSFITSSPCGETDTSTFYDYNFHGSFVAGVVTTNGLGVAGVAPNAVIVGVKVLDCGGSGSFTAILQGIMYAANLADVEVINLSLGTYVFKNEKGAGPLVGAVAKAVNYATSMGKLVVASAGNAGLDLDHDSNVIHVPSESGSAVAIYATDNLDTLASYSDHGVSGTWVGAPGGDYPNTAEALPGCPLSNALESLVIGVCSSFVCGGPNFYVVGDGTSFAAPMAAGVAALVDGTQGGILNGGDLKTVLSRTADDLDEPGVDSLYSHGRINASAAVSE